MCNQVRITLRICDQVEVQFHALLTLEKDGGKLSDCLSYNCLPTEWWIVWAPRARFNAVVKRKKLFCLETNSFYLEVQFVELSLHCWVRHVLIVTDRLHFPANSNERLGSILSLWSSKYFQIMFKNSVCTKRKLCACVTNIKGLLALGKVTGVYCNNRTEQMETTISFKCLK